ncbi:MAG: glycosyl hydrolase 115 family protein, partial [Candidatus Symbiothrix sp.]|nr:glycosyl hydrolase 115 family protein [Candidatus Symbiothrix sp.]
RIIQTDTIEKKEAFHIFVEKNQIFVVGSDARGTAYGILELSRLAGVSPWIWWADALPETKKMLAIPADYRAFQSPAVEYRGIFLNDEDWGLNPWSTKTFEPDAKTKYSVQGRFKGQIGAKTYEKIFQLLLRLRANTIWPAMHEVTMPFYFVEGNRAMAEKYGIIVGTSHCEPMMRNSATEWDLTHKSAYNYFTNRDSILSYWEERLKELGNSENIFTIGMRGKHDGKMEGARTTEDYKNALTEVIADQTELLKKYVNPDVSKVPQQFVPYKEVLDVYKAGLQVPDYVTLVWCDDNFGYIRHFPDETERQRSGGNGVYYHISYWGAPHDYLWLSMVSPALIHQQLSLAYEKNVRKIWIVNVGDVKPSEYLTELFLDLAWKGPDRVSSASQHLKNWLQREFGEKTGTELFPLLQEHYRLAHIRRPEFLGNTRVYDNNYSEISDLPFSEQEIRQRITDYQKLSDETEKIAAQITENKKDEYFQVVKYPVQAAAQMNFKMLGAQLARHELAPFNPHTGGKWEAVDAAFDSIASLTAIYNAANNGKWRGIMDFQPRRLPVFERVKRETVNTPLPQNNFVRLLPENSAKITRIEGFGCSGNAFLLSKNSDIMYSITGSYDSISVEVRFLPTHAVEGKQLRISVSLDGGEPQTADYETAEFSEEWKQNILRNYALRQFIFPAKPEIPVHKLKITALDECVYIDEIGLIKHTL